MALPTPPPPASAIPPPPRPIMLRAGAAEAVLGDFQCRGGGSGNPTRRGSFFRPRAARKRRGRTLSGGGSLRPCRVRRRRCRDLQTTRGGRVEVQGWGGRADMAHPQHPAIEELFLTVHIRAARATTKPGDG